MNRSTKFNPHGRTGQFQSFRISHISSLYFKGGEKVKDTLEQKELSRIASERWTRYQEVFVPAENKFIEESVNYDKKSREDGVVSAASAAVRSAGGKAIDNETKALSTNGVNASSGKFMSAINENAVDTGAATTDIVNQSAQALQNQKVQGMKNVVAIGNGQAAETMSGMGGISMASANEAANNAQRKADRSSDKWEAAGTVAGAGTRLAISNDQEVK